MPRNAGTIARARKLRGEMSNAEKALWRMLRSSRLASFKFRRQHAIGSYAVDFACTAERLVVEVDGPSHKLEEQAAFDVLRTAFLEQAGWRVLRVTNSEVDADPSGTEARILNALRS